MGVESIKETLAFLRIIIGINIIGILALSYAFYRTQNVIVDGYIHRTPIMVSVGILFFLIIVLLSLYRHGLIKLEKLEAK
jgi:hypothetical protein